MNRFLFYFLLSFTFFSTSGCQEDEGPTSILTEDILYISSNKVSLQGRILNLEEDLSDHGFQISNDENFSNPITVSLGSTNNLGMFIATYDELQINEDYYFRAYGVGARDSYYGTVKSLKTASPLFKFITPSFGHVGDIITIEGNNIPPDVKVYFNDAEGEVVEVIHESRINVKVPENIGNSFVNVTIEFEDVFFTLDEQFEYASGRWELIQSLPYRFIGGISFKKDNAYYIGMGADIKNETLKKSILKLDLNTWEWNSQHTELLIFNGFSNSLGYIGGGSSILPEGEWSSSVLNSTLFKLDEGNYNYFAPIANVPLKLFSPLSFVLNDEMYMGGGNTTFWNSNEILFKYDAQSKIWTEETTIPFKVDSDHPHFAYANSLYIVDTKLEQFWEYNTVTKKWVVFEEYPKILAGGGIGMVLNNKAYIGLDRYSNQLYSYDFITKEWRVKVKFPGNVDFQNIGSFTHNDKIYILRASPLKEGVDIMEVWELDPEKI